MSTNPFPRLDLRASRIEDQLLAIYHPGQWWFGIENALIKHTHPLGEIVKTIMEAYRDDQNAVLDVIPQSTINLIKEVYGN